MSVRYFAMVAGVVYLLVGVLGFIPGVKTMPHAGDPSLALTQGYGYLFGLFPVNILHNFVHLAIGFWGIAAYSSFFAARTYARGLAIIYGALAVMGLIPGLNTTFGLVPIFGHDVWLHAVTALVAAYFGFVVGAPRTTRAA
ncbi:MAG TPA: DUF4383 domain-containing protein [Vicinamibacterales bacterium]|nr:DUF4383 domain-containing protein [Vicinamibacterales bacterium]